MVFIRKVYDAKMLNESLKKRPLKILQVASHDRIRAGGAIQMMRLSLALKQMGHDVYCAFNKSHGDNPPDSETFKPITDTGMQVFSFSMQRLKKYYGMLRFRRFLSLHKFDVVHAHRFRALDFVSRSSFAMDVPVFIGSKKNSYPVTPYQAKIYGRNAVDSIIVNAKFIKNQLINTGRVNPDKIEIIYNGVDLDAFHPGVGSGNVRESFSIESGCPLFGMIANFAKKKSHEIFFGAALKVLKEMPDVKFLLVGGGKYMVYQSRMKDMGFGESFIFTEFRKDIPEIISSIDFSVISSSKGEGLTGSLVESMVMAKPVISTDVAGNPEFVKHMETGLLVPAGNVDKMADAMLYFLRNREAAEKMGKNAYALARDKFDNKKHAKCFEDLYYKIITRKKITNND